MYQSGLKLKKDKCLLAESSVKYLGHIIDAKVLHPLASKVEAIQNAPAPTNVNELQSFIGLISYYGKFLSNMSTVMAPLYELLRKDTDWAWEKDQIEAFDKCKTLINSDSVLVHFDPQYPVVLACDASPYGIGCVLSHSIDGIEKPIAFYSRTLKPAEKNYSVLDKEALSVVCGVKNSIVIYMVGRLLFKVIISRWRNFSMKTMNCQLWLHLALNVGLCFCPHMTMHGNTVQGSLWVTQML